MCSINGNNLKVLLFQVETRVVLCFFFRECRNFVISSRVDFIILSIEKARPKTSSSPSFSSVPPPLSSVPPPLKATLSGSPWKNGPTLNPNPTFCNPLFAIWKIANFLWSLPPFDLEVAFLAASLSTKELLRNLILSLFSFVKLITLFSISFFPSYYFACNP